MVTDKPSTDIEKGDHYRHRDGTTEVVYAVDNGVVLTIREYTSEKDFHQAVTSAEYVGTHAEVAALPDVEAMDDMDF